MIMPAKIMIATGINNTSIIRFTTVLALTPAFGLYTITSLSIIILFVKSTSARRFAVVEKLCIPKSYFPSRMSLRACVTLNSSSYVSTNVYLSPRDCLIFSYTS